MQSGTGSGDSEPMPQLSQTCVELFPEAALSLLEIAKGLPSQNLFIET